MAIECPGLQSFIYQGHGSTATMADSNYRPSIQASLLDEALDKLSPVSSLVQGKSRSNQHLNFETPSQAAATMSPINQIQHINQLPTEILARIFTLSDYERENNIGLLVLARVCKIWHDILFFFPHFWTHLAVTVDAKLENDGSNLPRHFDRWYGRAGDMPRSLIFIFNKAPTQTRALYDYLTSARWRNLTFKLDVGGCLNFGWLDGLIVQATRTSQLRNNTTVVPCWPDLLSLEILTPTTVYTARLSLPLKTIAPQPPPPQNTFADLTTFSWEGLFPTESESTSFVESLLRSAPKLEVLRFHDRVDDIGYRAAAVKPFHRGIRIIIPPGDASFLQLALLMRTI
ncbi:hypothetical protein DFP72DRAFT_1042856 [Ephemerocybe angulata]|uniref:F-box domain-containing protein n=1 Tax=Ephemerocybe angulata TaxID=980116 RepID=A0A8H6M8Z9_9AGAR|nr:hypothetical protein DFP72DRAFT_1042856 [Tulosesus angulatus]